MDGFFARLRAAAMIVAALFFGASPVSAQAPKLAVIAADRTLDPMADVLTAELSKNAGLTLLERGEISRLLGEQRLGTAETNCVRLGQLLRADGVVALRRVRVQQQELLVAELVSVRLGIRLETFADRFPVDDLEAWSARILDRFGPRFQKLEISPGEAIPISLLNLRAAVLTPETKGLERTLSFLLAERLIRQRQVFLLERQHLGALEFEKEFTDAETPAWAAARFVVDGEILQGGAVDQVILRIKIYPPGNRTPAVFTVNGSKSKMAQLVQETVSQILASVGQPGVGSPWEAQDEAKRFYREAVSAEWAGLDEESLAAGEASHALGYRSEELTALIARQSCRKAFSGRGELSMGYKRSQVNEATLDIGLAEHALELANEQTNGATNLEVLLTAARIIRYEVESGHFDAHRSELEALRSTLRAVVERFAAHPVRKVHLEFCGFVASYAPYLYDDPIKVLDSYRWVLRQRFALDARFIYATAFARHYLAEARDTPRLFGVQTERTPWLVAWRGESPEQLSRIWKGFLDQLSKADSVNDRLDALLLSLHSTDDKASRDSIEKQIRDALWKARQSIVEDKFTYAIAMELLYALDEPEEAFDFQLLDYFLKTANFYDYQIFERTFRFTRPELKAALLKSTDAYASRMNGTKDFQPAEFESYRHRLGEPESGRGGKAATRSLNLSRNWRPDTSAEAWRHQSVYFVRKVIYRDSQIWVLGTSLIGPPKRTLFQVDPKTLAAIEVELPLPEITGQVGSIDLDYDFEVTSQYVFVTMPGKLFRYDRKAHAWSSIDVPSSEFPALAVLGERLYYTFPGNMGHWWRPQPASGIIRIDPQTLEQQVLASSRRKQPASALDDVPAYTIPSLFLGPGGDVHAIIYFGPVRRGEVFRYEESAGNWTRVLDQELTEGRKRFNLLALPEEDGALFQWLYRTARGSEFSLMQYHRDGRLEHLIDSANNTNLLGPARWIAPVALWEDSSSPYTRLVAARDGKEYWVLSKDTTSPGNPLALCRYAPGAERPTVIPLSFASQGEAVANADPILLATPSGLVLGNAGGAACWMIAWEELEAFLKTDDAPSLPARPDHPPPTSSASVLP